MNQAPCPHENCDDEGLGIGRMTEEEFEIVSPDRLVNQSGKPRQRKEEDKRPSVKLFLIQTNVCFLIGNGTN